MAKPFKRTYKSTDRKTGKSVRRKTKKYYGKYRDANGVVKRVPLATDRVASEQMLSDLIRKAERARAGLADPYEKHATKPLQEHVESYGAYLRGKNNGDTHVSTTTARINAVFDGCAFKLINDISPSQVVEWLAEQRESDVFGITTSNHYLVAVKSFCRWLLRDHRTGDNRLSSLSKLNAEGDLRRKRRALSQTDFAKLTKATRGGKVVCGLSGRDREMLYLTAAYTGFRASELASLTAKSFDLKAKPPTVTIEAEFAKSGHKETLPLNLAFVSALRLWLAKQRTDVVSSNVLPMEPATAAMPLWPGGWAENRHGAKMMKHDLAEAELPYVDDDGLVFDFHALRGQFITELGRNGVSLQEAQKLARHSDPKLTANHYTHLSIHDLSGAVDRLPDLPKQEDVKAATGTDGAGDSTGPKLAPASDADSKPLSPAENSNRKTSARQRKKKTPKNKGVESDSESLRVTASEVPEEGLEPSHTCVYWILNPARLPIPPLWLFDEAGRFECGQTEGVILREKIRVHNTPKPPSRRQCDSLAIGGENVSRVSQVVGFRRKIGVLGTAVDPRIPVGLT